ncbi:DUF7680 family protein [Gemmata sp.]|uniref:DUF7680 family protein n=1 Tax=Gemmata sp. TaxID=1914242 RepID=UPI003F70DF4F
MERFVLTTKVTKGGRVRLALEMRDDRTGDTAQSWAVPYVGPGAAEEKVKTVLKLAERRGVLFNAEKSSPLAFPAAFDGSAREFAAALFDRNYQVGELTIEHAEGMRLAMAFMLAGRCNTVARMHAVTDGLTNLECEVVLYWFTLMAYGRRQKAGRAAMFTLLTAKN